MLRDRIAVLVRAVRRRQRLESLAAVPELVVARPDGAGGWQLSVVRRGRLVAAGGAPQATSVRSTLAGLLATAETPTGPDDELAASVDETELILRWMEKPGTRLVELTGTLASPAPGTGAFSAFLARVEAGRTDRDPFADGRSLGTRARPERVTADAGAARGAHRLGIAGVITAIVMIDAATDSIPEVAAAIADLDGVSEVYSVAGDVDLIAIVRVREFEQVAEVIAGRINKVPGVLDTETHIAFRAYSRHDLEAAFSIGFDDRRLTPLRRPAAALADPHPAVQQRGRPARRRRLPRPAPSRRRARRAAGVGRSSKAASAAAGVEQHGVAHRRRARRPAPAGPPSALTAGRRRAAPRAPTGGMPERRRVEPVGRDLAVADHPDRRRRRRWSARRGRRRRGRPAPRAPRGQHRGHDRRHAGVGAADRRGRAAGPGWSAGRGS